MSMGSSNRARRPWRDGWPGCRPARMLAHPSGPAGPASAARRQATITCSHRTVSRPRPWYARPPPRPTAAHLDPMRPHAGVGGGPGRPGPRDICDAHMLLGTRRAAERTHAGAHAAADVAIHEVARPAQRLHSPAHHRGVAPGQLGRNLRDVQLALHPAEVGVQSAAGPAAQPVPLGPALQHGVGRAKAGARVHQRGAAHRPARGQDDRRGADRGALACVPVQAAHHLARAGVEARRCPTTRPPPRWRRSCRPRPAPWPPPRRPPPSRSRRRRPARCARRRSPRRATIRRTSGWNVSAPSR